MNKSTLQKLIKDDYNAHKRFLSVKSAFVKELERFLKTVPERDADFSPDELTTLESILKRYADLPANSQSYTLRNSVVLTLCYTKIEIQPNALQPIALTIAPLQQRYEIETEGMQNNSVLAFLRDQAKSSSSASAIFDSRDNFLKYNLRFYQPRSATKNARDYSTPAITFSREEDSFSASIRKFGSDLPSSSKYNLYLGTNEANTARVAEMLANTALQAGGCHIGFSGWHNFDIMVMRQSGLGVICDINPNNELFLEAMLGLIRTAVNRHDFVKKAMHYIQTSDDILRFCPNVNDQEELYRGIQTMAGEVEAELARPSSWLYDDNHFQHIQHLALADKIVLITQDIRTTGAFSDLCNTLRANQIPIDSVYISNIYCWMEKEEDRKHFIETLTLLTAEDNTILIYATPGSKNLVQSALSCGELNKNNLHEQLNSIVEYSSQMSSKPK